MQKLNNIASIGSGIYSNTNPEGEVYYLQARDFDAAHQLETAELEPVLLRDKSIEKHFLKKGDVLVAAKSGDFFAAVYCGEVEPAVASTMFLVLRDIDQDQILSDFLAWYINLPSSQELLQRLSKGSSVQSINKKTLAELEIPLPDLKKQHLIIKISKLQVQEKNLSQQIQILNTQITNQQLLNFLKSK